MTISTRIKKLEAKSPASSLFVARRAIICYVRTWRSDEDYREALAAAGLEREDGDIATLVLHDYPHEPRDPAFRPRVVSVRPLGRSTKDWIGQPSSS
jgi:hypothetical protein